VRSTLRTDIADGDSGNDDFYAPLNGGLTLQAGDTLNLNGGNDTLHVNLGSLGATGLQNATINGTFHTINVEASSAVNLTAAELLNVEYVNFKTIGAIHNVTSGGGKNIDVDGGNDVDISGNQLISVNVTGADGKIDVDDTGGALGNVNAKTTSATDNITVTGGTTVTTDGGKDVKVTGAALTAVTVTGAKGKIEVDNLTSATLGNVSVETASTADDITVKGGKNIKTDGGADVAVEGAALIDVEVKNTTGKISIDNVSGGSSQNSLTKVVVDGRTGHVAQTHTIKGEGVNEISLKDFSSSTNGAVDAFDITDSLETAITVNVDNLAISGNASVVLDVADTVTINATGTGSFLRLDSMANNALQTINVAASADLELVGSAAGSGVQTVSAAGATGNVTFKGFGITNGLTITGGYGDDTFDLVAGDYGSITINGGDGDDTFTVAAGSKVTLTGGSGDDLFDVGANVANNTAVTNIDLVSISDFEVGDKIKFNTGNTLAATAFTVTTATGNLQGALDEVAADAGSTGGTVTWFEYDGDVYFMLHDNTTTLSAGDVVVKLVGIAASDIATASIGGDGTISFT